MLLIRRLPFSHTGETCFGFEISAYIIYTTILYTTGEEEEEKEKISAAIDSINYERERENELVHYCGPVRLFETTKTFGFLGKAGIYRLSMNFSCAWPKEMGEEYQRTGQLWNDVNLLILLGNSIERA